MEEELLKHQNYECNQIINDELKRYRDQGIKYEFRPFGAKWMAFIKLTNGFKLLVCPYGKKVTYKQKRYNYKKLSNWIKQAGLEVK